jgi:hypothetical protein
LSLWDCSIMYEHSRAPSGRIAAQQAWQAATFPIYLLRWSCSSRPITSSKSRIAVLGLHGQGRCASSIGRRCGVGSHALRSRWHQMQAWMEAIPDDDCSVRTSLIIAIACGVYVGRVCGALCRVVGGGSLCTRLRRWCKSVVERYD